MLKNRGQRPGRDGPAPGHRRTSQGPSRRKKSCAAISGINEIFTPVCVALTGTSPEPAPPIWRGKSTTFPLGNDLTQQ